jgi:predicted DNA-binding transcriptional regulator AlpA
MTTGLRPAAPSAVSRKKDTRLFVPVREAADALGVSRSTVMRANAKGQFPLVKILGTWRTPRRFIDDFHRAALHSKVIVLEEYAAEWMERNPVAEAVA